MPRLLHILTKSSDPLPQEIISRQRESNAEIEVVDLSCDEPDYQALAKKIFEADAIAVW